jgi:hypothetical protein
MRQISCHRASSRLPSCVFRVPRSGEERQSDDLKCSGGCAPERVRIARLEAELVESDAPASDWDAFVAEITAILSDVIRHRIQDSRDEMIEASYPILGQLIGRAVSETLRELARSMLGCGYRSPRRQSRDDTVRLQGILESALMRNISPFQMTKVFLVERQSGMLLKHVSHDPEAAANSGLVSGILTTIRDFAQDTFGREGEGQFHEVQNGSQRNVVEASRHTYLAAVIDGSEPSGFRADLCYRIRRFENA